MIEDRIVVLLALLFLVLSVAWLGFVVWVTYTVVEWLVTK